MEGGRGRSRHAPHLARRLRRSWTPNSIYYIGGTCYDPSDQSGVTALPFDESASFAAPPAFGTYRVLHQIGSGVLGPVFRTYDPQGDRLIAVKAFKLDLVPEDVARLADALRQLVAAGPADQTIVPLVDAGVEGASAFLAMEYVTGDTLDVALRDLAPAPLDRALPLLHRLARAIDAAWAAGTGHGALHPRDVFVLPGATDVRVTGMGIVPILEALGVTPAARRPYGAPERAAGQPWDIRADVYSLGAITHELLTRRRPVAPAEQDGTFAADLQPEQRVLLRRVLSAALAERPEHRIPSATVFAEALDAAARGEVPALLPGPPASGRIGAGRRMTRGRPRDDQTDGDSTPLLSGLEGVPAEPAAREADASAVAQANASEPVPDAAPALSTAPALAAPPPPMPPPDEPAAGQAPDAWELEAGHATPPMFTSAMASSARYPWGAIASVAVAGLVLGGLLGYLAGRRDGVAQAPAAVVSGPAASDTEVAVAPGSATLPAPAAPEPAPGPPARDTHASAAPARETTAAGRLVVRSVPSGAMVTVDGRPHGTTPATIHDLDLGSHTMLVARPGYVPHTERVNLTLERPARDLLVELTPGVDARTAAAGSVYVDTRPRGARVWLDGRVIGKTPVILSGIDAGRHALRIELAGHRPVATSVQVVAGEQARVTVTLERGQPGARR
jgi:eukaryotic-like serine/threonine-protein kinase